MYADAAAIFVKPTVADINNLKNILINFGGNNGPPNKHTENKRHANCM